ncbi:MAG: PQQ-binding-like beta-propeller repeat protein [Rhizomicrobium sp.]
MSSIAAPPIGTGKVYVGTLDGRLIAIDAKTGKQAWSALTVDQTKNYTITGAPRIVKGRVIIGNGGADLGGLRGYVTAYDAATGRKIWRFYTVPGKPGAPDGEISDKPLAGIALKTWNGQWWSKQAGGGGGTAWDSMTYDPKLDLLYVGVGNSGFWNKKYRSPGEGDNLFVGSILALRPETGAYVWHYQENAGRRVGLHLHPEYDPRRSQDRRAPASGP